LALWVIGLLPLASPIAQAGAGSRTDAATAATPAVAPAASPTIDHVILNEVKVDAPDTDTGYEWVELRGPAGGALTNLYLVTVDGDGGVRGVTDSVVDLSPFAIGSNGMLFVGSTLPVSPVIPPETTRVSVAGFTLENGSNSVVLVSSTIELTAGTDLDPDDDGDLDLTGGANMVDGIAISDGGVGDLVYAPTLGSGCQCRPGAATRFANATAPLVSSAWFGGALGGGSATETYDLAQITANFPSGGALSPGGGNIPAYDPAPWVLINELDVNPPGDIDGDHEWVEFRAPPGTDLSGWTFLSIDGDASAAGQADEGIDLNGVIVGTDGLVLAASNNAGAPVPPPETTFYDVGDSFNLENGTNSFLLFDVTLAIGPDYDVNNDGVLDGVSPAFIRDGLGWFDTESSSVDWTYGSSPLSPPPSTVDYFECACVPDAASRLPREDEPEKTSEWYWGNLVGAPDAITFGAHNLLFPVGGELTPGRPNVPAPECEGLTATMWGDGDLTGTSGADVIVGYGSDQDITPGGGDDTVCAGDGDDVVMDGPGNDLIEGEEGDDRFVAARGTAGQDVFRGAAGTDTADYGARTKRVVVWVNGAADDGAPGELDNIDTDVENLVGGIASDTLRGSSLVNRLDGGLGNDTLDAREGDDQLAGGDGTDSLNGGPGADSEFGGAGTDTFDQQATANGADVLDGGTDTDTVSYAQRGAAVTVTLDDDATGDGAPSEDDRIRFVEIVKATRFGDTLTGGPAADQLIAGAGNDHVHGGPGNDSILGQGGHDILNGDGDDDVILGAAGSDSVTGDAGTDQLYGGLAADHLDSQDGVAGDIVDGGDGLDTALFDAGDLVENVP
jgi:Ca2+-binding RTX toxin-like protein